MLSHLIRKEILDHLLSPRFTILSVAGILVIWLSLFSGYTYYQARVTDYRLAQAMTEARLRQFEEADKLGGDPWFEVSAASYPVHKPPTPLSVFVRGLDPSLGRSIQVGGSESQRLRSSPAAVQPILGMFPPLDLGIVVQVVLSLFCLLSTYDAVCGEKERGVLRLIASFPASRIHLLMAKLLGAWISFLSVFVLSMALGTGILLLMPDVSFTPPELARLGWILAACCLYLAAFTCAGLLASCLARQSATSFVMLLAFWALTVAVLPRLSLIAADAFRPAPSVHVYQSEKARLGRERLDRHRKLRADWQRAHSKPGSEWWRTPEGQEAQQAYFSESRMVTVREFETRVVQLDEVFRRRYEARLNLAVLLARLSPAFSLKQTLVTLAGAGTDRQRRFEIAHEQLRTETDLWYRKARDLDMLRQIRPSKYGTPTWDISDMPRFAYKQTWPGSNIQTALVDMGGLVVWGILFFLGSCVAVVRYDFR